MRRTPLVLIAVVALALFQAQARADYVGSADSYAVLGGSNVTNTGTTVLNGNLGLYPGTTINGFPPGIVNGTINNGNSAAQQAQAGALLGYNTLAGLSSPGGNNLTGQDLGSLVLLPGVYHFDSSAQLTGTLLLNAQGNSNAQFIFQIGSTLTTASASDVVLENSAQDSNVYWQVGSSATLGTTTDFAGTILADDSITLNTGADITDGRALALNGAVTLDTSNITDPQVPEPATYLLLGLGLAMMLAFTRKARLSAT